MSEDIRNLSVFEGPVERENSRRWNAAVARVSGLGSGFDTAKRAVGTMSKRLADGAVRPELPYGFAPGTPVAPGFSAKRTVVVAVKPSKRFFGLGSGIQRFVAEVGNSNPQGQLGKIAARTGAQVRSLGTAIAARPASKPIVRYDPLTVKVTGKAPVRAGFRGRFFGLGDSVLYADSLSGSSDGLGGAYGNRIIAKRKSGLPLTSAESKWLANRDRQIRDAKRVRQSGLGAITFDVPAIFSEGVANLQKNVGTLTTQATKELSTAVSGGVTRATTLPSSQSLYDTVTSWFKPKATSAVQSSATQSTGAPGDEGAPSGQGGMGDGMTIALMGAGGLLLYFLMGRKKS